jgi:hypothetical protein
MTVTNSGTPAAGSTAGGATHTTTATVGGTPAKKGNWIQQHKALAALGGAGVAILLLSHKGASGSGTDASTAAQDAAAEQAAIDQAVGDQTGLNTGSGGSGGDTTPSGGDGTTGSGSSTTGSGSGSGGGSSGGGDGGGPTTAITINEAPPTTSAVVKPPTTKAGPSQKTVDKNVAGLQKVTKAATGGTGKVIPKVKVPKTPAPKNPPKPTKPKSKTKGSVMKHGRAFSNAISCHVGRGWTSSDGVLHEPVTVNYPGYSETHMCHGRGQAWTDNVPGYTPPSRGVPLVRLGTPEMLGADWNESDDN